MKGRQLIWRMHRIDLSLVLLYLKCDTLFYLFIWREKSQESILNAGCNVRKCFSPIWKVRISEMFLNWGDTVYHPIQNWDMSFGGFKVKRNRREWLESKLQQWWDIFQCIVIFSSTWSGHLKVLQSCFRHEIA